MKEKKLETRYGIEAYISETGNICLKQDDPQGIREGEQPIIIMNSHDVPTVIRWLQELLEEAKDFKPEE
jgi:hypothetical protein